MTRKNYDHKNQTNPHDLSVCSRASEFNLHGNRGWNDTQHRAEVLFISGSGKKKLF